MLGDNDADNWNNFSCYREDLYGKIVKQRMGGWCFQLNGLFHWLLTELGFNVVMTGSSVGRDNGEWGNVKDHMALIAKIDGKRYLVDIGFEQYRVISCVSHLYFNVKSLTVLLSTEPV